MKFNFQFRSSDICIFISFRLDYCGIALLTMGSFVPWLYYSFYCQLSPKIIYLCLIIVLGSTCIVVSMWDKFAAPQYRPLRAGAYEKYLACCSCSLALNMFYWLLFTGLFIGLGLSGVIPCVHYIIIEGFWKAVNYSSLGWLFLMAVLYITGAVIYAIRIPERLFPGKFDIWVSFLMPIEAFKTALSRHEKSSQVTGLMIVLIDVICDSKFDNSFYLLQTLYEKV